MVKLGIILRKPPGDMNVGEAARHAMGGAVEEDFDVTLFLLDGGVLTAKRQKENEDGSGNPIEDCLGMDVKVLADSNSLSEMGMPPEDMIAGVRPAAPEEIAGLLKDCDTVMIF